MGKSSKRREGREYVEKPERPPRPVLRPPPPEIVPAAVAYESGEAALDELPAEEIDVAWRTLTSAPKLLRRNEVQSKLRAIAPSGAVDEAAWAAAAAETAAAPVLDVVDYESMETAELKAICKDRGIRPLPVRRLVIEDLRFYDAHGVAGVRHPATKQLSLPKKKK